MDPLSITVSVVALIQTTRAVISVCKSYISAVKDAPHALRACLIEVGSVKSVLEVLDSLLPKDGEPARNSDMSIIEAKLGGSDGPLERCMQALTALNSLFPLPEQEKPMKLSLLAWPFKEGKARKLLDEIGRYKATIALVLTTESIHDIKDIKSDVGQLRDSLNNAERQAILKWLVSTDPSPIHNRASELHEPHTGTWLVNAEAYKAWKTGSARLMWLHGIPGAGKTVLASFVIKDIRQYCKTSAPIGNAWAYYYCYFGRSQDETPHLIRWVINQLCRQSKFIPAEVFELYQEGVQPTTNDLVLLLHAVLRHFHCVYLIIDALDESSSRWNLLNWLLNAVDDEGTKSLRILALSRKELDIQDALEPISNTMSLSNLSVDRDIRIYIQNRLRDDLKFGRWSAVLKADVEAALVVGAKGMFRWAFCMVDILRNLKSEHSIRESLTQLPKTLDEVYQRILTTIPGENHLIAHKALQWLAYSDGETRLDSLAEAAVINTEQCNFDPANRLLDPMELLEICSCLITVSDARGSYKTVQLAHYTVKEYLDSDRIREGPAAYFYISEALFNILAARSCISYLLHVDYRLFPDMEDKLPYPLRDPTTAEHRRIYPFVFDACNSWYIYAKGVGKLEADPHVTNLVLKLLEPRGSHFKGFHRFAREFGADCGEEFLALTDDSVWTDWICPAGGEPALILAYTLFFGLYKAAEALLAQYHASLSSHLSLSLDIDKDRADYGGTSFAGFQCFNGTPLHLAAEILNYEFIELYIKKGVNINIINGSGFSVLNAVLNGKPITERSREVLKLLLLSKADPNLPGVRETPLQMAVRNGPGDIDVIKMLLEAGTDVNAVGNDEVIVAGIRYDHGFFQVAFESDLHDDENDEEDCGDKDMEDVDQCLAGGSPKQSLSHELSYIQCSEESRVNAWNLLRGHCPGRDVSDDVISIANDIWRDSLNGGRTYLESQNMIKMLSGDNALRDGYMSDISSEDEEMEDYGSDDDDRPTTLEEKLHYRGYGQIYNTPLRIAELRLQGWHLGITSDKTNYPKQELEGVIALLKSYGAKSLHLFPIQELPGFVEEDILALANGSETNEHIRGSNGTHAWEDTSLLAAYKRNPTNQNTTIPMRRKLEEESVLGSSDSHQSTRKRNLKDDDIEELGSAKRYKFSADSFKAHLRLLGTRACEEFE